MQHSDPGRRASAGKFYERLLKEVGGHRLTIGGAGAHIGEWAEVLADRVTRKPPGRGFIEAHAYERALSFRGALRGRRHAAAGDACANNVSSIEIEACRQHDGGNVLVETLGHLEGEIVLMGREPRRLDGDDKLARAAILLAVSDEEIFERQGTRLVSLAQNHAAAKSDQGWRQ